MSIKILMHLEQLERYFFCYSRSGIALGIENLKLPFFHYQQRNDQINLSLPGLITLLVDTKSPVNHPTATSQQKMLRNRTRALVSILYGLLGSTPQLDCYPELQQLIDYKSVENNIDKPLRFYREVLEKMKSPKTP